MNQFEDLRSTIPYDAYRNAILTEQQALILLAHHIAVAANFDDDRRTASAAVHLAMALGHVTLAAEAVAI